MQQLILCQPHVHTVSLFQVHQERVACRKVGDRGVFYEWIDKAFNFMSDVLNELLILRHLTRSTILSTFIVWALSAVYSCPHPFGNSIVLHSSANETATSLCVFINDHFDCLIMCNA